MASPAHAPRLPVELRRKLADAVAAFGWTTRARGLRYAREGRVSALDVRDDAIEAVVRGGDAYRVRWEPRGRGDFWLATCGCPVGVSCKHAYAVAAVLLGDDLPLREPTERRRVPWRDDPLEDPLEDPWDEIEDPDSWQDPLRSAGGRGLGETARRGPAARLGPPHFPPRGGAAALKRLREARPPWDRHAAAAELLEPTGLRYDALHALVSAASVDDSDPDVRCWSLASAVASRLGAERVPPVLEPFLDRPDIERRIADRRRQRLREDLLAWATHARPAPRRTLRALVDLRSHGDSTALAIEVRVTSPRGETPRGLAQLRQLRAEVRDDPGVLPGEQAALLALLVDVTSTSAASRVQPVSLPLGALRLFLDHGTRFDLVRWSDEIDPALAERAGVVRGAPVRLAPHPVHLAPACVVRDGEVTLELRLTWDDGRSAPLPDAVFATTGDLWRADVSTVVVAGGEVHALGSAPPPVLVRRFREASGLPLAPEERVPVLSRLAARWPHIRATLAAHTRLVAVEPVVVLDLREDDWLAIRVLARRLPPDARDGDSLAGVAASDFEWTSDATWRPVAAEDGAAERASLPLDAPGPAVPAATSAAQEPVVVDAWQESPDPARVGPVVDWLASTAAFPGDRRGPGGVEVPWPDRARGFWMRVTSKRVADLFAAWERRPAGAVYLGNERARRLLGPAPRAVPKVRLTASGVDFLAVSADWETEAAGLSPDDLAALRAATTRFVRLRSGWVRKPDEAHAADAVVERALADLGVDVGAGEQRLSILQLAGASAESLAVLGDLGVDAETERAVRTLRERIAAFRGLPRVPLPRTVRAKLRPYQRDGLDFLAFASDLGTGAILADDMGLGKTLQALAWLEHLRRQDPDGGPALVVCPASVVHNWRREAERFVPSLRVLVLERGDARHELRKEVARHDLVVTNYALLRRDAAAWRETELRAAILDEAQNVKNPDAAVTRAAHGLRARHCVALTGTPLENRPLDLFSIASFVCPGYFGSRAHFVARFDRADLPAPERALLAARLRPILLRRLKRDVARDLPDRVEERRDCELTAGQRKLYLAELARSRDLLARLSSEEDGLRRNKITILAALTRLRQICCHPALAGGKAELGSGKLDALMEVLEPLLAEGHKVLVFSQFVALLRIVARELEERGVAHHVLTGETVDRESVLRRFADDPRPAVFLLSLKAGGTGLNLTSASYVVLFDPWWNPAVEAQAIDRSHRIGQDRTVIAYRLIARGTIEEKIAELQERKATLVRDLLGDGGAARGLTREDLEFLLAPEPSA